VLDFGLAKLAGAPVGDQMETLEKLTREGRIVGTAPYMSPEQLQGMHLDARSDVFSLGVVLYEMATGRRPFAGESAAALISSILRDEPASTNDLRPELPRQLGRILRQCLTKDPERRFQSAKDLRNQLEELREEMAEARRVEKADAGRRRDSTTSAARLSGQRVAARRWALAGSAIVVLLAVAAVALYVSSVRERLVEPVEGPRITSLAVLPLANLMGDSEQDYFVEGMHEALTAELAKIGALKVISRTSAMRYRDTDKAAPQIARELGVEGLVEGSVLRDGDVVRITVQLIHGSTDRHLWAESYQRELRGILALQSEVARAIANEVEVTLTPAEELQLAGIKPVDPRAYESFLRGQYEWSKYTRQGWEASIEHFERSIEQDPTYAPAYAMMSLAYVLISYYGSLEPPAILRIRASQAAERAVTLDGSLADAHASLAMVKIAFDWDWAGAGRASAEALRLNPGSPIALFCRAFYLSWVGRHDEAIAVGSQAVEIDPVAPHVGSWLGMFYFMARHYDEAISQMERVLTLEPEFAEAHMWAAFAYAKKGMLDMAAREWATLARLSPPAASVADAWIDAWLLSLRGRQEEARTVLDEAAHLAEHPTRAYFLAIGYGEAGDADRAFTFLERAYRGGSPLISVLEVDPRIDALRDDPRFDDLLRRMNFPR
jgi:adenylate cyclase